MGNIIIIINNNNIKSINSNKAKHNNLRSSLKKPGLRNKLFLVKMILTHYTLVIYLTISIKGTYLNYLDCTEQTISVTTLVSKYHFLKILGKEEVLFM